jgi:hypothetical protein
MRYYRGIRAIGARTMFSRVFENFASRREPALGGFCKYSHGIGWKLEAWLTGSGFVLSLKPLASSEYPPWLTA